MVRRHPSGLAPSLPGLAVLDHPGIHYYDLLLYIHSYSLKCSCNFFSSRFLAQIIFILSDNIFLVFSLTLCPFSLPYGFSLALPPIYTSSSFIIPCSHVPSIFSYLHESHPLTCFLKQVYSVIIPLWLCCLQSHTTYQHMVCMLISSHNALLLCSHHLIYC